MSALASFWNSTNRRSFQQSSYLTVRSPVFIETRNRPQAVLCTPEILAPKRASDLMKRGELAEVAYAAIAGAHDSRV